MGQESGQKNDAKTKKKGGVKLILLMALAGCLVPFGLPTLLVCAGLIPTLIVLLTETEDTHAGLATVGYMNVAGVLPFLIDLWQRGQTMDAAMAIVREPRSWVVMLGAAGVGQLVLYAVPPIIASIVLIKQADRLRTLREAIKELEAIWGPEVATAAPVDEIRQKRGGSGPAG